jgi:hypothetical protein
LTQLNLLDGVLLVENTEGMKTLEWNYLFIFFSDVWAEVTTEEEVILDEEEEKITKRRVPIKKTSKTPRPSTASV